MDFTQADLTNMLRADFINAFKWQDVEILVVQQSIGNFLLFKINPSYKPTYTIENSVFGRSLRFLVYLQENHSLLNQLKFYSIQKVSVTEAIKLEYANSKDKSH